MRREAAIALLTVVGPRAVERLVGLLASGAAPRVRIAALRVLEAIADPRGRGPALEAMADANDAIAAAAVSTARVFLRSAEGASVVDRLTAVALDTSRAEPIRLVASWQTRFVRSSSANE